MKKLFNDLSQSAHEFFARLIDPSKFAEGFVIFTARMLRFAKAIIVMPVLYVFIVMWILSFFKGFWPIPMLHFTDMNGWFRGVLNGIYLTWVIMLVGFVQREEEYSNLSTPDKSVQGISAHGNKHWSIYAVSVVVSGVLYLLEHWLTQGGTGWWFVVGGFIQILPLLLGDSLREQARHLLPKIANWVLLITALWYLAVW